MRGLYLVVCCVRAACNEATTCSCGRVCRREPEHLLTVVCVSAGLPKGLCQAGSGACALGWLTCGAVSRLLSSFCSTCMLLTATSGCELIKARQCCRSSSTALLTGWRWGCCCC